MPCSKWLDFICRCATAPFLQCIIVTFEQVQLATCSLVLLFHNFLPLLHMICALSAYFIYRSQDVDLEHDVKQLKSIKHRLAAVVFRPVFISRVQHLPSFKNGGTAALPPCVCCPSVVLTRASGIVPLDSLVRVLLSSSEFEPRLSTDDIRVLMAGLQVVFSNHDSILDPRVTVCAVPHSYARVLARRRGASGGLDCGHVPAASGAFVRL